MSNGQTVSECRVGEPLKIKFNGWARPNNWCLSDAGFTASRRAYSDLTEFTFMFKKEGTHRLDFYVSGALPKTGEVRSIRIKVNP